MAVFAGLVGWNAQSLNRIDRERRQAEHELQQTNLRLEQRVAERTAQLQESEQRLSLAIQGAELGTWDVNWQTGTFCGTRSILGCKAMSLYRLEKPPTRCGAIRFIPMTRNG